MECAGRDGALDVVRTVMLPRERERHSTMPAKSETWRIKYTKNT
jgi:hypothetical protein